MYRERGIEFTSGVKVKAIFCFGIPILDSNWEYDDNTEIEVVDEIFNVARSEEFKDFCEKNNVIVDAEGWKEEDCSQILLAHKNYYIETTSNDYWENMDVKNSEKIELVDCLEKLCELVKEKTGIDVSHDAAPCFFLHLWYD